MNALDKISRKAPRAEIAEFEPGDTVRVHVKIKEGDKERIQSFEGVVIARGWSLLEYNVPKDKLVDAERIAPGFNSPTINALEDDQWCAVQVMVERKNVIAVMDQLEQIGATAILETRITNCRL